MNTFLKNFLIITALASGALAQDLYFTHDTISFGDQNGDASWTNDTFPYTTYLINETTDTVSIDSLSNYIDGLDTVKLIDVVINAGLIYKAKGIESNGR